MAKPVYGNPSKARDVATLKSQLSASYNPPPNAEPSIAAIVGTSIAKSD